MENSNICLFNTLGDSASDLFHILHFVYEKQTPKDSHVIIFAAYKINLVTRGKGYFILNKQRYRISEGDLFFTFPSLPMSVVNESNLEFMYISFYGPQVLPLFERVRVSKDNPVVHNMQSLTPFWADSLSRTNENNIDIVSQCVILYSLSNLIVGENKRKQSDKVGEIICKIKQTVDRDYFLTDLNLNKICAEFFYNPSYISSQFKNIVGTNFSDYLQDLRLKNAIRLMQSGYKQIKDIALTCGFADPLYFSKVFKKTYGISPSEYIASQCTKQ